MDGAEVDVVGYFDLGAGTGAAPTAFVDGLDERDRLGKVLCRGIKERNVHSTAVDSAFPLDRRFPQVVGKVLEQVPGMEPRLYFERAFDWITARRLANGALSSAVHYQHTPGHLRSIQVANELGMWTVLAGAVELTKQSINRYENECDKHNLSCHVPAERRRAATRRLRTLQECDQIVAMSSFAADSYVKGGVDRNSIDIVPLGVDTERFSASPLPSNEPFRVTFVGTVNVLKGIPYLLAAWEQAGLADDSGAELRLCGNVAEEVTPLLEASPANITTPGFVDPFREYRQASVCVFPSLSEGFAKAPLEAMSTGRPVIVTENTGTPEIMVDGHDGIIVPPGDIKALAGAFERLRADPNERVRMGEAARATAEQHTWDRYVTDLLDQIDSQSH